VALVPPFCAVGIGVSLGDDVGATVGRVTSVGVGAEVAVRSPRLSRRFPEYAAAYRFRALEVQAKRQDVTYLICKSEDLVDAIRNAGLEKVTTAVRFVPTLVHMLVQRLRREWGEHPPTAAPRRAAVSASTPTPLVPLPCEAITSHLRSLIAGTGVRDGVLTAAGLHTTMSHVVNENGAAVDHGPRGVAGPACSSL